MKKYKVKFLREFEVEVEAESGDMASQIGSTIIAQFPKDSCKLLSIVAEDYVEAPCEGCLAAPPGGGKPPHGKPTGGGNPGSTVVKVPVLVDQIAVAA